MFLQWHLQPWQPQLIHQDRPAIPASLSPAYTQVTVSDVSVNPGTFATGDEGTITVVVQNTGTQSVTIRRATLYDRDITLLSTTTYDSVGSIGAGNKIPFTFTVKADVPEGIYYPVFSLEFQDTGFLRYPVKLEVKNSPVVLSVTDKPDTFVCREKKCCYTIIEQPTHECDKKCYRLAKCI